MLDVRPAVTTALALESSTVVPGSRVRVRDAEGDHEYTMVTRVAADSPPECVSLASPVGIALLGRRPGDRVQVHTPGGIRLLTVVAVVAAADPSSPSSVPGCEA
jgi:transcription elongation GreA/GreB family factor